VEQRRRVKHAAPFLLFFLTLWWLWQLLAGEWGRYQWLYGLGAAVVAAAIAELAATRAGAHAAFPWEILKSAPSALGMVFVDFAIVMRALVQRRNGVFRTTPFDHPDTEGMRAWAMVVADYSPNAYIVDISGGETISHHLVENPPSQSPA
jgi:hypothetical protein